MLLTLLKSKQLVLMALLTLSLGACKQSEFYDKSQVLDPGKNGTNVSNPTDPTNPPVVVVTPAKVDCSGSWGTCSKTCGGGIQSFTIATVALNGGVACEASNGATQSCNNEACPPVVVIDPPKPKVDCSGSWGACSKTCGGGIQSFSIQTYSANGGNSCVANSGATQSCNTQACPPVVVVDPPKPKVDCSGSWGACSKTCGGGTQAFSIATLAANGGNACVADNGATQTCNTQACPPVVVVDPPKPAVDCVGSWGSCSKTCGGGTQLFNVSVNAANGGRACGANAGASQNCNPQACSIVLNDRKEVFVQDSLRDGDVDILWMIDNSGSMANKQKRLSDSLGLFIDKFLDKNINFKMAITTTDGTSSHNGKMVGDVTKLDADYLKKVGKAQFMSYFQSITKVGTSGSGTEQGLKTSTTFFDRYGSTFLRKDAYLAVIIISDEEDQSDKKVSDYLIKFQSLKASPGMVKVYSVVTQTLPTQKGLEDSIGARYMQVSAATGGTSSEIKNDFSTISDQLGTSIVNLVDSFSLAQAAYNNQVQVYVNKNQETVGWTYDSTSHSLKFDKNAVPKEGSTVEIRYQVQANVLGAI